MSKEMLVIVLGVFVVLVRTVLGFPGSWQTALFILAGVAIAVTGFLLRGEAISRAQAPRPAHRRESYPFADAAPAAHDHQEGITSLN